MDEGIWEVDTNEDDTAVRIKFDEFGEAGATTFVTAMPPEYALKLGEAIIERANGLLGLGA